MVLDKKILAYALKNAIEHEGKARVGSVVNSLFNAGLKKSGVKKIIPEINKVIGEVNKLSIDNQGKEFEGLKVIEGKRISLIFSIILDKM